MKIVRATGPSSRDRRIRTLFIAGLVMATVVACTSGPDQSSTTSVAESESPATTTIAVSQSPVGPEPAASSQMPSTLSPTPTTQPGVLTGPGIDDSYITLGSLVEPSADRGFQQGLALWAGSINELGGICGRWVQLSTGTDADLTQSYQSLGASVLGFAVSTSTSAQADSLSKLLTADQMPAISVGGTSKDLQAASPVVVGATDDILAINALDSLITAGTVVAGDKIGVVMNDSAAAEDELKGLTWRAAQSEITVLTSNAPDTAVTEFAPLPAVFAFAGAEATAELALRLPSSTVVMTDLSSYRADLLSPASAKHVHVVLATPAFGSQHPGAIAVTAAFNAAGLVDPGPLLFAGYAVGATWQRLLTVACDEGDLTREAVTAALTAIGPASVDGMFGGSDPAQVVQSSLPASRSSSIAQADPAAPSGLTALVEPFAAEGIGDYSP